MEDNEEREEQYQEPMPEEEVYEDEVVEEEPIAEAPPVAPAFAPAPRPGFSFGALAQAVVPKQAPENDLADLFEVPQDNDNDMYVDDLFELDDDDDEMDDDDISDLFTVTREDVMGRAPKPRPKRFTRTNRPYDGNTRMGGMR